MEKLANIFDSLSPQQEDEWNTFHDLCPQSHPFQTLWFSRIREQIHRIQTVYFELRSAEGRLCGTAIMNIFRHRLIGYSHANLMRGPTCEDLPALEDLIPLLIESANALHLAAIRLNPYFENPLAEAAEKILEKNGFALADEHWEHVNTSVIDLGLPEEEIFSSFHKKMRWEIRREGKEDAEIKILESAQDIREASVISEKMAKKKGTDILHPNYLSALAAHLSKNPRHGMSKGLFQKGRLVSFAVFLGNGRQVWYVHGGSDPHAEAGGKSHLLLWDAIQEAKRREFQVFNLGGVEPEVESGDPLEGINRFKQRFSKQMIATTRDHLNIMHPASFKRYRVVKSLLGTFLGH